MAGLNRVRTKAEAKGPLLSVRENLARGLEEFNRIAMIGLLLLLLSFSLGLLTRNSAYITNTAPTKFPSCDNYGTWLCIPTLYVTIPLFFPFSLILNLTSFISSAVLFVLGILLVRSRDGKKSK